MHCCYDIRHTPPTHTDTSHTRGCAWAAMKTGLSAGCGLSYQPVLPWSPQKNMNTSTPAHTLHRCFILKLNIIRTQHSQWHILVYFTNFNIHFLTKCVGIIHKNNLIIETGQNCLIWGINKLGTGSADAVRTCETWRSFSLMRLLSSFKMFSNMTGDIPSPRHP